MAFLFRLYPILYPTTKAYCLRYKHYSIDSKTIHFLCQLKLCRTIEGLKPLSSLLIVHGLHGDERLIGEFFRSCFRLGVPRLALSAFRRIQNPSLGLHNLMIRCLCHNGLYEDILHVYIRCRVSGCPSDEFTFPFVIKACAALGASGIGKEVHCVVFRTGFENNLVIQTALVDFYAKSGCMRTAHALVDRISQPDLVPLNALIAGYSLNGFDCEAYEVFRKICLMDLKPNLSTLASVIPVCTRLERFEIGKSLHGLSVKSGYFLNDFLVPTLISMYAGDTDICSARKLFDSVPLKTVAVWNAIISACTQMQKPVEAFMLFRHMLKSNTQPNLVTFVSIIPSCEKYITKYSGLHAFAIKHGSENQPSVLTAFLSMYAKLGDVDSAKGIFYQMPNRNRLAWNSMVSGFVYNGLWELSLDVFCEMQCAGFDPDSVSIVSIVSACSKLEAVFLGKSVHAFSLRRGFESNLNVSNAILAFYSGCSQFWSCFNLFHKMPIRNVVSWNTLISSCAHSRDMEMAFTLLYQMQEEGLEPDLVTLISILPGFSKSKNLGQGMAIHCCAIKTGFDLDVSLVNALISMYCNCGDLDAGRLLFYFMPEKRVVSWNAMMTGLRLHNLQNEVMGLFGEMMKDNQRPNHVSLLNILPACYIELQGKSIHAFAIRTGIVQETPLLTSLIIMYARFDDVNPCILLFQMGNKEDISLWNAIMSVYTKTNNAKMAITIFSDLLLMGLEPDNFTILSLISACVQLNSINLANSVMAFLLLKGFDKNVIIGNALIDLYARCGNISIARKLFDELNGKDTVSWTVMINGYGLSGDGKAALDLFLQMELSGIKPDSFTYSTILSACSHTGLAKQGSKIFKSMAENGIPPGVVHYSCMVDLLGRTGHLTEAYEMVKELPCKPSTSLLESLLGACRIHGNVELGEKIGRTLSVLDPENSRPYVMLYNIYASAGRWTDAERVSLIDGEYIWAICLDGSEKASVLDKQRLSSG
ncbi:pentatricopeptide repeat-containing protein At4g39952, mitochondrial [Ziziphus jujuba]|uniref:Pentatricopeptide repeat-containing protein At4g39952, mitochondrial n=1 Tax=Ziziphus jujuba TaxID=326968 RepID=A0ABM3IT55_ZIZJJ|nr:pentatricopeptide repeat-containing protein At4g39952, mitochondrial [Ziziphus jujuba]